MGHKGIEYVISLDVLTTGFAKNSLQKNVRLGLPNRERGKAFPDALRFALPCRIGLPPFSPQKQTSGWTSKTFRVALGSPSRTRSTSTIFLQIPQA